LIDRTISSLALPDKNSGFCPKQKGKSRAKDSQVRLAETRRQR